MQILPTSISSNQTLWDAASNNRPDDQHTSSFMEELNKSLREVEESASTPADSPTTQETPVSSSASTAKAAVQVESPYSRSSRNGVTYTLDEVCFTKQEVQTLYKDLIKAGATPESLAKLASLADMPDGATLAQVKASVKGGGGIPVLSDDDKANITSLLKKIDPSGILDTTVQAMMMQGNAQQAYNAISTFMSKLDPAGSIEVSQSEALSLGRGLGLGSSNLQTLANSFGGSASLTCLNEQFGALMAPVTDFFATQAAAQKTLDTALKTTLQPRISKARTRTEKEKQANALRSRTAQQSKVLIDKTVQQKTNNILGETLDAGQQASANDIKIAAQSEMIGKDMTSSKQTGGNTATDSKTAANQRSPLAEKVSEVASGPQTAAQTGKNTAANQTLAQSATQQARALDDKEQKNPAQGDTDKDQKNKSSWSELLGKIDAQAASAAGRGNIAAYAAQPVQTAQTTADLQDAAAVAPIARQVAQQVEQGMLSSLKGGGTRLDLQLNPQELGSINVSLTVRNGEVSAIIRSEKSETTDMINRQVDAIRSNLEQQGIKVDKVEVRQDTRQDQNSASWQDFTQHNARQEEDARREELARLKNLASVRNSTSNSTMTTLEQPVHSLGNTAIYATSNLNVVA